MFSLANCHWLTVMYIQMLFRNDRHLARSPSKTSGFASFGPAGRAASAGMGIG